MLVIATREILKFKGSIVFIKLKPFHKISSILQGITVMKAKNINRVIILAQTQKLPSLPAFIIALFKLFWFAWDRLILKQLGNFFKE